MGLADDRKPVNLMTVHVSKSVTAHEVSNNLQTYIGDYISQSKKRSDRYVVLSEKTFDLLVALKDSCLDRTC